MANGVTEMYLELLGANGDGILCEYLDKTSTEGTTTSVRLSDALLNDARMITNALGGNVSDMCRLGLGRVVSEILADPESVAQIREHVTQQQDLAVHQIQRLDELSQAPDSTG